MESKTGIILEGGAMRSVFSAGVMDYLLEQGIHIPNVLAVSAGAYVGVNYASGQKGRVLDSLVLPLKEYKFLGFGTFLKKGTFFDMDYLFDVVPREKAPFDFEAFRKFDGRFLTSTVNLLTGETVYYEKFANQGQLFQICKAANSLPMIAKIVPVDGIPMLDGGMSDAIPVVKALQEGWEKMIVVLTRDKSYRKTEGRTPYVKAIRWIYKKYPKFLELVDGRAKRYNDALEKIEELEKEGKAFVIRPTEITVENGEANVETLTAYYQHGYDSIAKRGKELRAFLGV